MGLYAENGEYDSVFISNYIDRYVRDELRRIDGVGEVFIFGEREYAMRLWLDPLRLAANGLSPADVLSALREQNVQVAAGQIGAAPAPDAGAGGAADHRTGHPPDAARRAVELHLAHFRDHSGIFLRLGRRGRHAGQAGILVAGRRVRAARGEDCRQRPRQERPRRASRPRTRRPPAYQGLAPKASW